MTPDDIAAARRAIGKPVWIAVATHVLPLALDEVERAQRVEAQAISAMNAAHAVARAGEVEIAALRDRISQLTDAGAKVAGLADRRVRELEQALHEALDYWSADMPDTDEERERLRAVARKVTL